MIIGVDFDGTVVRHEYPEIGDEVPGAVAVLKDMVLAGHKIILWTMRSGDTLQAAVLWFAGRGIDLYGVNMNPDQDWSTSPKAYCHIYIDDAALGCPMVHPPMVREYVDWPAVREALVGRGILPSEGGIEVTWCAGEWKIYRVFPIGDEPHTEAHYIGDQP